MTLLHVKRSETELLHSKIGSGPDVDFIVLTLTQPKRTYKAIGEEQAKPFVICTDCG